MFSIDTNIGSFIDWRSLYLEMKATNTSTVKAECSYCFERIAILTLTLDDVQTLASDDLLDDDIINTIQNFVQAVKQLN